MNSLSWLTSPWDLAPAWLSNVSSFHYLWLTWLIHTAIPFCFFNFVISFASQILVCLLFPVFSVAYYVRLFATPWTVACQAPLSVGFSRQEYWSRLPFPPPWLLLTQEEFSSPFSSPRCSRGFHNFTLDWKFLRNSIIQFIQTDSVIFSPSLCFWLRSWTSYCQIQT